MVTGSLTKEAETDRKDIKDKRVEPCVMTNDGSTFRKTLGGRNNRRVFQVAGPTLMAEKRLPKPLAVKPKSTGNLSKKIKSVEKDKGWEKSMKSQQQRPVEIKINTHHRRRPYTTSINGVKTSGNKKEEPPPKPVVSN
ncbi:hypothetical protein V6N11_060483 [Hibiscus sabdariffa]|uniref:Uncharacterized protein n=1 Tax=Hibiscus sabdariffa TaxID=183260 RepID=A0ABR2QQG1_9ROSI